MKKYSKREAIKSAKEFIKKVVQLEKEYGLSFNSDEGDIYLSYQSHDNKWENIDIGWEGDGTPLKVLEKDIDSIKEKALSKLTQEERDALGL